MFQGYVGIFFEKTEKIIEHICVCFSQFGGSKSWSPAGLPLTRGELFDYMTINSCLSTS